MDKIRINIGTEEKPVWVNRYVHHKMKETHEEERAARRSIQRDDNHR